MNVRIPVLLILILFCACNRLEGNEPLRPEETVQDTLRILAIGNSFSADAVEQNLWELLDAADIPAVVGNI